MAFLRTVVIAIMCCITCSAFSWSSSVVNHSQLKFKWSQRQSQNNIISKSHDKIVRNMSDQAAEVEDFCTEKKATATTLSSTDVQCQSKEIAYDPLTQEVDMLRTKNVDWYINTFIILAIGAIALTKVTLVDDGLMRGWTSSEIAYRIPLDNWLTYNEILDREPVFTKAVTSATVYTIGDVLSQRTEGRDVGEIDRWRVTRSMLAGLIAHGPLSHVWYNLNENLFENVLHWTAWWSFFPKVVLDQTTWGPFWNNTYILLLGLMQRASLQSIWSDVQRTTIPLIVSGLKLWPLAHCVTYGLIPVENRLLWVDLVEIIWVVILSSQAAGTAEQTLESEVEDGPKI